MSTGNKRNRNEKKLADTKDSPSNKRRKIDYAELQMIKKAMKQMWDNYGKTADDSISITEFAKCFDLLLSLPIEPRTQIMKTLKRLVCMCRNPWCVLCRRFHSLSNMIHGHSYKFMCEYFLNHDHTKIDISKMNKMKLDIIRNISYPLIMSNGEVHRTPILTIEYTENFYFYSSKIQYYNGAIKSLDNFTAELFLESVVDFNFFRFVKKDVSHDNNRTIYVDCTEAEVLDLLNIIKLRSYDKTLLLLTFFMITYYKNFIFFSIKNAVQNVSGMDNDTLSQIMSFMLTYHASFNTFFQDKQFIKSLMDEVNHASAGWQDILVDIIQKDEEINKLYEPNMERYYSSEKLNLLNMQMDVMKFNFNKFKKWLKEAVRQNHCELFKKLMDEYCENKMDAFKYLIWYCYPHNKGEKMIKVVQNEINSFEKTLKVEQEIAMFQSLCSTWRSKVKQNRKSRPKYKK